MLDKPTSSSRIFGSGHADNERSAGLVGITPQGRSNLKIQVKAGRWLAAEHCYTLQFWLSEFEAFRRNRLTSKIRPKFHAAFKEPSHPHGQVIQPPQPVEPFQAAARHVLRHRLRAVARFVSFFAGGFQQLAGAWLGQPKPWPLVRKRLLNLPNPYRDARERGVGALLLVGGMLPRPSVAMKWSVAVASGGCDAEAGGARICRC